MFRCRLAVLFLAMVGLKAPAAPTAAPTPIEVEIKVSRVHGLINFVETAAGEPNRSRALKEFIEKSGVMEDEAVKSALESWRQLGPVMRSGTEFSGYPASRSPGLSVNKILLAASAFAPGDSIDEFLKLSGAILPPDAQATYVRVLRHFAPHYDRLVWQPSLRKIESYRKNLEAKARVWGMAATLGKIAGFYGANWPATQPFTIVLYPMPGRGGHSSAESLGALESVGVFVDEGARDIAERYGVLVHEICHSFYDAQPLQLQSDLAARFNAHQTSYGPLAGRMINEALATALGNGWAATTALGQQSEDSWYADSRINAFAHAIYDPAMKYMAEGRAMDPAFVDQAIATYKNLFPDAPRQLSNLLYETTVLTEGRKISGVDVGRALRQRFRIPSMTRLTGPSGPEELAPLETTGDGIVIAATAAELPGLLPYSGWIRGLGDALDKVKGASGDAVFVDVDTKGRALVLIRIEEPARLDEVAAKLAGLELVPHGGTLVTF